MNIKKMKNEINTLRVVLNTQIKNEESFDKIIKTSREIDLLINRYYKLQC